MWLRVACPPTSNFGRPREDADLVWEGTMFVDQGAYSPGVFKFRIFLPREFPSAELPVVTFVTKIFHPVRAFAHTLASVQS